MKIITKKINDLSSEMLDNNTALILSSSFEERAFTIGRMLCNNNNNISIVFVISTNYNSLIVENAKKIQSMFGEKAENIIIKKEDPFSQLAEIYKIHSKLIEKKIENIIIDITTFTHETLLILVNVLNKKNLLKKAYFFYNSAKEYCPRMQDNKKWLSKGCKEIRTILGYPGLLLPNRQTCIIVLVGFEHERASRLIELTDPDSLYIGCGIISSQHITSEKHMAPMKVFEEMYKSFLATRMNVNIFEFSARDIENTVKALNKVLEETKEYNHIIVPMNTKISTIATGLIALQNPAIQLCYAEPEIYNFDNYSIPDERIIGFQCYIGE